MLLNNGTTIQNYNSIYFWYSCFVSAILIGYAVYATDDCAGKLFNFNPN